MRNEKNMDETKKPLYKIIDSACEICYACVRACPVKAITVQINQEYPFINPDRCIGCGDCLGACTPHAIVYAQAKDQVKALIARGDTAAIIDPSISGEFVDITDYRKFVEMIRAIGFKYVNEASFGVDLVSLKYRELIESEKGKYFISANCPSIVDYVEKYRPELINNLVPIVSPMVAMTKVVRKKYDKNLQVVVIGPCVEAKKEATHYEGDGKIDAVLTFVELRELFEEFAINEKSVHFSDFDPPIGYKGSLFPISQSLKEIGGIHEGLLETKVLTVDGGIPALEAVKTFDESINKIQHHFNLFYCKGCLMGPGTSPDGNPIYRRSLVTEYSRKRLKDFDMDGWKTEIELYQDLDLSREYENNDKRLPIPQEVKVKEILKLLGKGGSGKNVGCGSCGYNSCRDFAESVANSLAKTDMCIQYSLNNKKDYIETLKRTNEKLSETQKALKESEAVAREEQQRSQQSLETTSAVLQELSAGVVVVDSKLKVVQSNKRFIDMMGDDAKEINEIIPGLKGADLKALLPYQFYNLFSYVMTNGETIHSRDVHFEDSLLNVTIFPIKKGKMVGAVIRDLQMPEVRKEEVINRVTEVIDQNLDLVQKIGFVLGEGAAKTEKMLNSIIETYARDKKK